MIVIVDREEDRLCPVIEQVISEIECYETVNGCSDTSVYKQTQLPHAEVRRICAECEYSNLD